MLTVARICVAPTLLMTSALCCGQAPGNPSPDLDIGVLISKGTDIAKRETTALKALHELDTLKEAKEQSDKVMTDWKPKVEAYQHDCGKSHVWNKDDPV